MIDKKLTALLGSLLLLAAAMPMATAHLTNPAGSWSSAAHTQDGDLYRWSGLAPSTSGGVSGSYDSLAPTGNFLTGDVFPLTFVDNGHGQGDITLFPLGYASFAFALCDLEVLGDGTGHDPLDETKVDNDPTTGNVPDGTFDDGGFNGACHTDSYGYAPYNTLGCGTGGTHAVAEDLVSEEKVFIGASCDELTTANSSPGLTTCIINHAIQGGVPQDFVDCVNTFVSGNTGGPVQFCGPDHVSDAINYGPGGGDGSAVGVPYPTTGLCAAGQGSSAVFTFNYVAVNVNTLPEVVPATVGWIDSRDLVDVAAPVFGPGLNVPVPP